MALEPVGVRFVAENQPSFIRSVNDANASVKRFADDADHHGTRLGRFTDGVGKMFSNMGRLIGAGVAIGAVALAGFAASTVNVAADYETTLNRFTAVTGSAITDAGLSLDQFSKKFLQLGMDTQYSAQQSADAAVALAKGGVPVTEIMNSALEATMNLAAAGELELAPAAEIVAKALGVWRDTGVDAYEVADLLSQAANASTVDVDELALGLYNAQGTARLAGLSFNELVTTMALLAPGFGSAADAGTSLKTFLSRLVPSTAKATGAMMELGLYTAETGSAFYDAQGNFKGMEEATALLHEATKNLSQEQKQQYLQTIFGQDAIRVAEMLARSGADGYLAMADSMETAGSAAEQAKARQQGFNFAMDQFKGSIETLQIIVGTALIPTLTSMIGVFTEGVNLLMMLTGEADQSTEAMARITMAIDAILPGSRAFITTLQTIGDYLVTVWNTGNTLNGWLSGVPESIRPIVQIGGELVQLFKDNMEPVLVSLAAVIGGAVVVALGSFVAAAVTAAAPIIALIAVGALLYEAWNSNFMGIRDVVTNVLGAIWGVIQAILTPIQDFVVAHSTEIKAFFTEAWTHIQNIIGLALAIINETIVPILQEIAAFIWEHRAEIVTVFEGMWTAVKNLIGGALTFIEGILKTALQLIRGDWEGAWQTIQQTLIDTWEQIRKAFAGAIEGVKKLFNDGMESIKTKLSGDLQAIINIVTGIGKGLYDAGKAIIDNLWSGMRAAFDSAIANAKAAAQELRDLLPGSEPKDPSSPLRNLAESGQALVHNIQAGMDKTPLMLPTGLSGPSLLGSMGSVSPPASAGQIAQQTSNITNAPVSNYNYQPVYRGAPNNPSFDFAMMQALAGGA